MKGIRIYYWEANNFKMQVFAAIVIEASIRKMEEEAVDALLQRVNARDGVVTAIHEIEAV